LSGSNARNVELLLLVDVVIRYLQWRHIEVLLLCSSAFVNTRQLASLCVLGTTRDTFKGKKVVRLEYEAYVPMAEKELAKICQDIRNKWNVVKIAIVHRIG
jgi:molybdopterin synthase catalytic subunit